MRQEHRPPDEVERRAQLAKVWEASTADRERLALYIEHRGLPREVLDGVTADVIRFNALLPYRNDEGHHMGDFPAMVAKITDVDGKAVDLHRTYLSPDGPGKLNLGKKHAVKKLMTPVTDGATKGASIRRKTISAIIKPEES